MLQMKKRKLNSTNPKFNKDKEKDVKMRKEFVNRGWDARKLRLSNIGRKDRFLWNHYKNLPKEN